MARNEEKAQSMLYRFREAQAAELGLGTRSDRRPRMASACKSLRECERWRGEILREISRKVSKIQDSGLTDYEVRDVNDEINKLLREKRHWENQIIALGGANYRRNVAMLDDDGREVPGTKGYKYFGRAKELPGVKELFESRKKDEDEESAAHNFHRKFTNQGPAYFGDLDEVDGELLKYEEAAEQEEWEEAHAHLREVLGLPEDTPVPKIPRGAGAPSSSNVTPPDNPPPTGSDRSKSGASVPPLITTQTDAAATTLTHARAAAAYIPFLSAESLLPPKMPTREEMEGCFSSCANVP
ncbi:Isy1-like splicing family-domain-containing protein [Multifurca ochricompacta]|uniref:Isy1-like splicing family-domain-containing protein n=1 Tax=Multifurca ochricompacta TaxID=376703 RepID=A0AAD4M3I2_9AGAM|nr:Isy1-like splicing family-domain-containing protein [Multifurca ochricompacta]